MHVRKQIRQAIATALTGETDAGANVFVSRVHALPTDKLPAICIWTAEETSTVESMQSRVLSRTVQVSVVIYTRATDDIDDVMDDIAEQVEPLMDADITFDGLALKSNLASTSVGRDGQTDQANGAMALTYNVTYRTKNATPGTPA